MFCDMTCYAAHCKMQRYGKSLRIKNNLRKTLFYSQFFFVLLQSNLQNNSDIVLFKVV